MPLPLMANSSDTTNQGGKMERNSRMMALQQRMNKTGDQRNEYMRFMTTQKTEGKTTMNISTYKSERQVLMQHMKAAHKWSIS